MPKSRASKRQGASKRTHLPAQLRCSKSDTRSQNDTGPANRRALTVKIGSFAAAAIPAQVPVAINAFDRPAHCEAPIWEALHPLPSMQNQYVIQRIELTGGASR